MLFFVPIIVLFGPPSPHIVLSYQRIKQAIFGKNLILKIRVLPSPDHVLTCIERVIFLREKFNQIYLIANKIIYLEKYLGDVDIKRRGDKTSFMALFERNF